MCSIRTVFRVFRKNTFPALELTDLHGNPEAFKAVMKDAIVLVCVKWLHGNITGYGG